MASHSLILPNDNRGKLRLIALSLLFVVGFHLVFQPFQMRFYSWDTKSFVLFGYAAITALTLFGSLFVLPKYYPTLNSKVNAGVKGKFIWLSLNTFVIGIGFFVFKVLAGFYELSLERIGTGVIATLCVGAIPAGIFWLWTQKSKPKSTATEIVTLRAQRGKHSVTFNASDILYLETEGNYVAIVTKSGIHRLRSTLTFVENQLDDKDDFVRCHRAFVVRLSVVEKLIKEAHNHFVVLGNGSKIPVSRDRVKQLRELL